MRTAALPLYTRTCIIPGIYIFTTAWPSGRTAHCPPTRTHAKRPLEDHLRYTRYVDIYPQNEHPAPTPAVQAFDEDLFIT